MALFWPIFIALIIFGIVTYLFGVTRKAPIVKGMLFVIAGMFLLLTGALIQDNGILIDWPSTMAQSTVDGITTTEITYTELSAGEGSEVWMLAMGITAISVVPLLSALIVVAQGLTGRKHGPG